MILIDCKDLKELNNCKLILEIARSYKNYEVSKKFK